MDLVHDNFYFTDEQIENSPSRADGVDDVTEFTSKVFGCELIQEGAVLLKASQAVACTGQVLLHRFYAKRSLKHFDVEKVAASCTFLACKLEEQPRKIRDVLNVFHFGARARLVLDKIDDGNLHGALSQRDKYTTDLLDVQSDKYDELKRNLIRTERHLLREFGFCVNVEHPHAFVLNYLRMFSFASDTEFVQSAWAYANDSLRTNLCIRFKASQVACACVHLASRFLERGGEGGKGEKGSSSSKVPSMNLPKDWFVLFDVTSLDLKLMCESVLALYVMCPPGGGRARFVYLGDGKNEGGDGRDGDGKKENENKEEKERERNAEPAERVRLRSPTDTGRDRSDTHHGRSRDTRDSSPGRRDNSPGPRRDKSRDKYERKSRSRSRDRRRGDSRDRKR